MFVVVLAAETDGTGRSIAFLIGCLLAIAGIMTALTIWYWRFTSPRQVAERLALSLGPTRGFTLVEPDVPTISASAARSTIGAGVASTEDASESASRVSIDNDEQTPEERLVTVADIAEAVRQEEADKGADGGGSFAISRTSHSISNSTSHDGDADNETGGNSDAADNEVDALVLRDKPKDTSSDAVSDDKVISDEAWERITQTMLTGYKAEKSDT